MNRLPTRQMPPRRAFTLVELMVSMAVLAIILMLFFQMVTLVTRTWQAGAARTDNFAQTRTVLGLIERDIQSMVLRPDLAAFVDENGDEACAFYTAFPLDSSASRRKLSLVQYKLATPSAADGPKLCRMEKGLALPVSGTLTPDGPTFGITDSLPNLTAASPNNLVDGVVGFRFQFMKRDGGLEQKFAFDPSLPDAASNTPVIVLSILVLDTTAYELARSTGSMAGLSSTFAHPPAPNQTYAQLWESTLLSGTLTDLPEPVRAGLRTVERRITIPITIVR